MGDDGLGRTPAFERILSVLAGVGLVLLAMFTSPRPIVTLGLLVAAGVAYGVLIGAARLVKFIARRGSKGTRGYLRLALASLGGPGSLAPIVAPALGLGLSLMCMIATIQANILGQLRDTAPANAPSIIFRQIPSEVGADFDAMMKAHGVDTGNLANYRRAPFLLGRVLSVKGVPTRDLKLANDQRWVIRGEMPMTYIGPAPPELQLASGKWWAADYAGPLLVSVEQETADALGVRVGDHLAFRFFGRDLEAEVSSIRKVDWSGFGVSMAFVFSPGTLEAARPFATALVRLPPDKEDALVREVADRWPGILAFQLRRTLETAADLFQDVSKVVTILASVVTLAGVLVLFGAFAAAARRRRRESALLKTFGATRAGILALYAGEFGLAGLAAAILGAAMGVLAANRVVAEVLKEVTWRFSWGPVLTVSLIAVAAAATGGAVVGWATLSHRPARVLRSA
jgi:putative ABC transport system permease protein